MSLTVGANAMKEQKAYWFTMKNLVMLVKTTSMTWPLSKIFYLAVVGLGMVTPALANHFAPPAHAQVMPDNTLSTTVTSPDNQNFVIENGDRTGNNLFHSFSEFSIPTNGSANFNNATDIETIFSRVTGTNASNIDGLIQTKGNVSLFLLNPNGILFGPNARLDINGSFFGTTADTLLFDDGSVFSTAISTPSLLSVNVPVGLQWNRPNPSPITLQNATLEILTGTNLALLGGDLSLNSSTLIALQGRVTLGSLGMAGTIQFSEESQAVSFPKNVTRGDVTLNNASFVGVDAGSINVITGALNVLNGSTLEMLTNSPSDGENINVDASGAINISGLAENGFSSGIFSFLGTDIDNMGGNIIISSPNTLTLSDGGFIGAVNNNQNNSGRTEITVNTLVLDSGQIFSSTGNLGNANNIILNVENAIQLTEANISSATFGPGDTGHILIETGQLNALGSEIVLKTFASGNARDISINSQGAVEFNTILETGNRSIISNEVGQGASGTGGDINIEASTLQILDGSGLQLVSRGTGDVGDINVTTSELVSFVGGLLIEFGFTPSGILVLNSPSSTTANGDVTITTKQLQIFDGAQVSTSPRGTSDGGNITVVAQDSVDIAGRGPEQFPISSSLSAGSQLRGSSGDGGDLILHTGQLRIRDGGRVQTFSSGSGNGGDIVVNANSVSIMRGGITATASGEGNAGELTIFADSILLGQLGRLSAETNGGSEGNIDLIVNDLLTLRRGGSITTNAAKTSTGGNININAPFIVAVPMENSDIVANAVEGNGGNIQIMATGIFGLEFRSELSPLSDITASSQFGVDGVVQIDTPDLEFDRGIVELPSNLNDPSNQISTGCLVATNNSLTVSGRGGLPDNPGTLDSDLATWEDWRPLEAEESTDIAAAAVASQTFLEEATNMVVDTNGQVKFVVSTVLQSEPYTASSRVSCH